MEPGSHGKYQWDMGHCSALIKVSIKNFISSDCVDLLCHEPAFLESSLFMLYVHKETPVKVLLCGCHLCLYRILGPVLLICVQGQGKNQTKPTETDNEKLLELLRNGEIPWRGDWKRITCSL